MFPYLTRREIHHREHLTADQGLARVIRSLSDTSPGADGRTEIDYKFIRRHPASLRRVGRKDLSNPNVDLLEHGGINDTRSRFHIFTVFGPHGTDHASDVFLMLRRWPSRSAR